MTVEKDGECVCVCVCVCVELGCWTVTVEKMIQPNCDCEENEGGEGGLCKL